jgi:hypothetical protein
MGLLDRHGKDGVSQVRTVALKGPRRWHIRPEVRKHVEAGSAVYTDQSMSGYARLTFDGLTGHGEPQTC